MFTILNDIQNDITSHVQPRPTKSYGLKCDVSSMRLVFIHHNSDVQYCAVVQNYRMYFDSIRPFKDLVAIMTSLELF